MLTYSAVVETPRTDILDGRYHARSGRILR